MDINGERNRVINDGISDISQMAVTDLTDLPDELKFEIIKQLPVESVVNATSVSKNWTNLFKDQEIWKSLYLETFPGFPDPSTDDWMSKYKFLDGIVKKMTNKDTNAISDFVDVDSRAFAAQLRSIVRSTLDYDMVFWVTKFRAKRGKFYDAWFKLHNFDEDGGDVRYKQWFRGQIEDLTTQEFRMMLTCMYYEFVEFDTMMDVNYFNTREVKYLAYWVRDETLKELGRGM